MLDEMIATVSAKTGLSTDQTRSAVGLLLRLAQEKLGPDFAKVQGILPEADALIAAAPQPGGLGAFAGSLLGSFGGGASKLAGLATLVSAAEKAGIGEEQLMSAGKAAADYVSAKHPEIGGLLAKVL